MEQDKLHGQEDREITEREARAYRAKKNQKPAQRKELPRDEVKLFLRLVSEMASSTEFETKLDMRRADIDYYKQQLDVEDPREARSTLMSMDLEDARARDDRVEDNRRQAREAEAAANARLKEYEAEEARQQSVRAEKQLDPSAIADADSDRQRLFEAQKTLSEPETDWRLPEVDGQLRNDIIRRFQHELLQQGWNFCRTKYGCTSDDLKSEARRLGLRINWDLVPR
jgi:hypothetical protein